MRPETVTDEQLFLTGNSILIRCIEGGQGYLSNGEFNLLVVIPMIRCDDTEILGRKFILCGNWLKHVSLGRWQAIRRTYGGFGDLCQN